MRIGTAKQAAVKAMLAGLTPMSYQALNTHMSMMKGEPGSNIDILSHVILVRFFVFLFHVLLAAIKEDRCAFSDAVLGWKFLWPGSPPAEGQVPSEAEEIARRSAVNATKHVRSERLTCLGLITHFVSSCPLQY